MIKSAGKEIPASGVEQLMNELAGLSGSVSVIVTRPSGMKAAAYVDVAGGVVRRSYGEQRVLKAADFSETGEAFS